MAGRYPSRWLDELREKADILSVVGSYVTLKKNGHRYVGLCPFHNETAPSFSVDAQKQVYYCFGCKAGGSVIQFVMDMEHLGFQDAVEFLANRVHMPLPEMENDPGWEARRTMKERVYAANKEAARLYHRCLWSEEGAEILAYLKKRGLSDGIIRKFGIGAAPQHTKVCQELLRLGFTQEELLNAGLLRRSEKDGQLYDMFRNRAIFPIIDAYGNVIAFGGRAMGDAMPKYLNTGDTIAFNKRYNVFAANLLRKSKNLPRVLLVEGYMDVVTLYQYGVEGAAATLGTALTPEQAKLLHRFGPEVHLAYDGDRAGQQAIMKGLGILAEAGVPAKVVVFPDNLDPDEFLRQRGAEAFGELKTISPTTYRLQKEKERHDVSTEEGRQAYAKGAAEILKKVQEPVELEDHIRRLALETGYSREVLMEQVGTHPAMVPKVAPQRDTFRKSRQASASENSAAKLLLAILLTGRLPKGIVSAEDMPTEELQSIAQALLEGASPAELMERQPDENSRQRIADILTVPADMDDETLRKSAQDCLNRLRKEKLEKEIREGQERIAALQGAEKDEETKRVYELTMQLVNMKG